MSEDSRVPRALYIVTSLSAHGDRLYDQLHHHCCLLRYDEAAGCSRFLLYPDSPASVALVKALPDVISCVPVSALAVQN
jgi:hypothetical protein